MRIFLALLIALCMLLPCAAGFTPAAAEGGTDSSQPRSGTSEDRNDDDADDDDDGDDDDDDDDDKGGSFVNPNDLSFKGPLSDYQPKRENYSGLYWGTVFESGNDDDRHDGTPEYRATFSRGKLKELEVEIELDGGREYEVVFSSSGKILRAEYETESSEIYYDGSVWRTADGKKADGPDLAFMSDYFKSYRLPGNWYPNNTMCLVGLSLRDMYPSLTSKWYQFVPVDLTKEGVFRYATAASNMYYMGSCIVTVEGGNVTVDYTLPWGKAQPESDCLMWFTDISEITPEFLETLEGSYRFSEPVSIEKDLKGQDIALLFICNHISYHVPLTENGLMPIRVFRIPEYLKMIESFEELFARMK